MLVAAYVRRAYRIISHMRGCPYTRGYRTKRSKYMFSRSTIPYHRGGIYKYPICQKPIKSKRYKIRRIQNLPHRRILHRRQDIYWKNNHHNVWLPHIGFVYLWERTYVYIILLTYWINYYVLFRYALSCL